MSSISVLSREIEVLTKGFEVVAKAKSIGIDVRSTQALLLSQFASCLERCRNVLASVKSSRTEVRKSFSDRMASQFTRRVDVPDLPRLPIRKSFALSGIQPKWKRVGDRVVPYDPRTGLCCGEIVEDMEVINGG